jgi:thioredoxin 1
LIYEQDKENMSSSYIQDAPTFEQVSEMDGLVLLEFGTSWCTHCQAAQQFTKYGLTAYPQIEHVKILDGKGKALGRAFGVKLWPTLVLLREGQEVARLVRPTQNTQIDSLLGAV